MTLSTDLVVIGGGLGGLTAAALAAKAGLSVVVLEKATGPGGRAATTEKHGFALNLGAHALYRGGPAMAALDALGVAYPGREPPVAGGFAFLGDTLHTLPTGLLSLVSTDVCGLTAKLDLGKLLGTIAWIDAAAPFREPERLLRGLCYRLTGSAADATISCRRPSSARWSARARAPTSPGNRGWSASR